MFKRTQRRKNASKKRTEAEGNDDDGDEAVDEGTTSLQERLNLTKKRRTLIDQLQYKRGVDANDLMTSATDSKNNQGKNGRNSSISSSSLTLRDGINEQPLLDDLQQQQQTIWDKKHAAAMEEYIEKQLMQKQQDAHAKATARSSTENSSHLEDTGDSTGQPVQHNKPKTKEQLYRELAAEAARLGGGSTSIDSTAAALGGKDNNDRSSKDVLTAGAATALAEVILPVADRLQVVTDTVRASATANSNRPQKHHHVRHVPNAAVPNRFRSHHNHHHPLAGGSISTGRPVTLDVGVAESNNNNEVDAGRLGFAAARQQQQQQQFRSHTHHSGNSGNPDNNNSNRNLNKTRASDDRVYQQFVKRQREQHHGR